MNIFEHLQKVTINPDSWLGQQARRIEQINALAAARFPLFALVNNATRRAAQRTPAPHLPPWNALAAEGVDAEHSTRAPAP